MAVAPKLSTKSVRVLILCLTTLAVFRLAILPFLGPILIRNQMRALKTNLDSDGVCRQTSPYTCGPAAAVTLLRRWGIKADEGELAIRAGTGPTIGTPPDLLCGALKALYKQQGITCHYQSLDSIEAIPAEGYVIAVVELTFFMDHYVVVLEVEENHVIVADPLGGRKRLTHEQFKQRWRHAGIVVKHPAKQPTMLTQ